MNRAKIISVTVLLLALAMVLCACGADNNTPTTEAAEPSTAATAAPTQAATQAPTEADDGKVTYTVTVVDEGGNPVAGALVQLCLDACIPSMTDDNGVAQYNVEPADYKVSFLQMPEGYEYSTGEQEFYFADGAFEMTIVLKAVA